ncbi:hypothetical protein B0H13DRAFT_2364958 [Mycena leptocephala]|nr:hypothetical protein B0H13DRAFT_2364958 [Mycena leptocephala]
MRATLRRYRPSRKGNPRASPPSTARRPTTPPRHRSYTMAQRDDGGLGRTEETEKCFAASPEVHPRSMQEQSIINHPSVHCEPEVRRNEVHRDEEVRRDDEVRRGDKLAPPDGHFLATGERKSIAVRQRGRAPKGKRGMYVNGGWKEQHRIAAARGGGSAHLSTSSLRSASLSHMKIHPVKVRNILGESSSSRRALLCTLALFALRPVISPFSFLAHIRLHARARLRGGETASTEGTAARGS